MFIRYAATHSRPSEIFRQADIKNCFWCKRQMPEELQPAKLEVAGSSPVSAANYGRVAQWIERVKNFSTLCCPMCHPLWANAIRITFLFLLKT